MNTDTNHTANLDNSIRNAIKFVRYLNHDCIGTEHVLFGLLSCQNSEGARILARFNLSAQKVKGLLESTKKAIPSAVKLHYSPNTNAILEQATEISLKAGVSYVSTEHVLLAILCNPDCYACLVLRHFKVNLQEIKAITEQVVNAPRQNTVSVGAQPETNPDAGESNSTKQGAEQFGVDLTARARAGKLDPVIGRDSEIERVIRALSRRNKNSPVLVGEAGVGKSAVVEGLALAISQGNVPDSIKGKRIISLDLASILAGAEYRGEFEKRFKSAIEGVKEAGIILFIDEIHNLVGAGAISSGSMDAGEIVYFINK